MRAFSRKNLWEAVPPFVKQSVGRAAGWFPPALLLGRRFRQTLRFLDEAQHWPAERCRGYQLEHLRRICTLAYEKTPYYRRTFDQVGFNPHDLKAPEDLAGLPTIDKRTLREHLSEMCALPLEAGGIDYVSTGGSTGVPLHFHINASRSATEYAYLLAGWQRVGYRLEIPQAVLRGQIVEEDRSGLRHAYDPLLRRHYYSNFHMTDENMRRYVEHMRRIGPCFLHVYPSSIAALTRFLERSGLQPPGNVRGVLAGSETVYAEDRAQVERVWGLRYCSWYGHSEKLVLAAECEHSSDYHVWPTYGYFELLDEEGRPITTPGQRGEIVGTGFINTVVPFVRYRTGDQATYAADRCPACGREHPVIRDVEGRWPSGALVASDGAFVSMTALNVHDQTFDRVRQYQFYQDTVGEAVIRIVPAEGFGEADEEGVLRTLNRRLNGRVKLRIELCDSVPLSPRGKAIWVDQRLAVDGIQREG